MITTLKDSSKLAGTSFHCDVITATTNELIKLFGEPSRSLVEDKVTREWDLEYNNIPFSIYDWKEYREYTDDEVIDFHIGTHKASESHEIASVINSMIKEE